MHADHWAHFIMGEVEGLDCRQGKVDACGVCGTRHALLMVPRPLIYTHATGIGRGHHGLARQIMALRQRLQPTFSPTFADLSGQSSAS
jgi:hypothetical protein